MSSVGVVIILGEMVRLDEIPYKVEVWTNDVRRYDAASRASKRDLSY